MLVAMLKSHKCGSEEEKMMRREGLAGAVTFCLTKTLRVGSHGEKIEEKWGKLAQLKVPSRGKEGDRCECWLPSVF